ncbi:MAG: ABC transporter ATP-binding protein [Chloroflexaceae bacterium]|jgi:ABC-2 type transport system ATP-binding protein|nr:ABC transporter ATP-binding protein [Chloroflexaceae bacterium]
MDTSDAITIENLHKSFGPVKAVDGLNLTVPRGSIYGLVGPDGAGKTTTIRVLCGAIGADSGRATVAGIDVARDPDGVRRKLGYVAQRFSLYGDLTVLENMRFFANAYGVARSEQPQLIARLLEFSRLGPFYNRRAEALSGGMKQKLALACALIHQPTVLLLDEPSTGVDPVSRREFWDILRDAVVRDGMTVLVATPYMDEADRCHQVGFVQAGRVLASGTPRDLQRLVAGVVLELQATPREAADRALRAAPGVRSVQVFGDRLHVVTDTPPFEDALRGSLAAVGVTLHAMRRVVPTMEDVFMQLAAGAQAEAL